MSASDLSEPKVRAAKLREILERDPADATTWFTLGRTLLDLSQHAEAAAAFRHAIEHQPDYTAAHRDLARALLDGGEPAEAARVLRAGLPLAERNGDLQTGREMETFLGRAERALGLPPSPRTPRPRAAPRETAAPESAAEASPQRAEARALYKRGFERFANDDFDEAIALYHEALAVDPELAIAWNGLSLAHRQKGDLDAAVEAGVRLIELEPDDALSHTNLSILYQRQGKIPEAEDEKAIAMQLQLKASRSS